MNYVMGDDGSMYEVMGSDDEFQTVGAAAMQNGRQMMRPSGLRLLNPGGQMRPAALQLRPPPSWRPALAPGVPMPGESEEQLSMVPDRASGIFSAAVTQITFEARPQRPFRAERVVAIIGRVGASAAGALPVVNPGFFVGTNIVGANLGDTPLDGFGPTAFGVRLQFPQATPGMNVSIPVSIRGALTGTDTLTLSMFIVGRSVRLPARSRHAYSSCHTGPDHHTGYPRQRSGGYHEG